MNQIYNQIAETVNEMIPEEWEKFHYYAQISETGAGHTFFITHLRMWKILSIV